MYIHLDKERNSERKWKRGAGVFSLISDSLLFFICSCPNRSENIPGLVTSFLGLGGDVNERVKVFPPLEMCPKEISFARFSGDVQGCSVPRF